MKVALTNVYMNSYVNRAEDAAAARAGSNGAAAPAKALSEKAAKAVQKADAASVADTDTLITKKERDFFIKMFPENSAQLEKHVLFNRNGKISAAGVSKGQIIDGRI